MTYFRTRHLLAHYFGGIFIIFAILMIIFETPKADVVVQIFMLVFVVYLVFALFILKGTYVRVDDNSRVQFVTLFSYGPRIAPVDILSFKYLPSRYSIGKEVFVVHRHKRSKKEEMLSSGLYKPETLSALATTLHKLNNDIEFSVPFTELIKSADNPNKQMAIYDEFLKKEAANSLYDWKGYLRIFALVFCTLAAIAIARAFFAF